MREILRLTRDSRSMLYGYTVMWTNMPEFPYVLYHVDRRVKTIYINKGAQEGASVVSLY